MLIDWRRIAGTLSVLLLAGVLIYLTVTTLNSAPDGGYEVVTKAGDWVLNGEGYNARSLTTVLFIGVGDGASYGSEQDVRYLTLLAIDEKDATYSLLHLDPDTQATVGVINENGSRVSDPRITRIAEAQKYGNGYVSSCINTVRSVEQLLHNTDVDYYICVHTGAETPAFTTAPIEALTVLAQEMADVIAYNDGLLTTADGELIEQDYTTVITDMTRNQVNDCIRFLTLSKCEADESFRGVHENDLFIPDREQSDGVISRLYFRKK